MIFKFLTQIQMPLYLIILTIVLIVIIFFILAYNTIVAAKNQVKQSQSSIEVYLQNRYDLIPNLIEIVKQYTQHEKQTLQTITELRNQLLNTKDDFSSQRIQKENQIQQALKSLFALAENYPDLKANQNFLELQKQWQQIEDNLAASRRAYNAALKRLTDLTQMFPYNLIAKLIKIPNYAFFEATPEAHSPVKI